MCAVGGTDLQAEQGWCRRVLNDGKCTCLQCLFRLPCSSVLCNVIITHTHSCSDLAAELETKASDSDISNCFGADSCGNLRSVSYFPVVSDHSHVWQPPSMFDLLLVLFCGLNICVYGGPVHVYHGVG